MPKQRACQCQHEQMSPSCSCHVKKEKIVRLFQTRYLRRFLPIRRCRVAAPEPRNFPSRQSAWETCQVLLPFIRTRYSRARLNFNSKDIVVIQLRTFRLKQRNETADMTMLCDAINTSFGNALTVGNNALRESVHNALGQLIKQRKVNYDCNGFYHIS